MNARNRGPNIHAEPPLDPRAFFGAAQDARVPAAAVDTGSDDDDDDDDYEEEDDEDNTLDDMASENSSISDISDSNLLSQMIDSLSLGHQKTPKKNAADEEDGSSHRRIKTVFEQSSVIYPILAPEFYTQGDGRKVATCTIPISSDVADVKGFIDTDRRMVRLVFEYNTAFLEAELVVSGIDNTHSSFNSTNAMVVEKKSVLPLTHTQVFHTPFPCEELFYPHGIGKEDGLFLSLVVASEDIPARAQVEFAVVEHATDNLKKRSASKKVYNHAAEVLRRQQEEIRYEEWKRAQAPAANEAKQQQGRDRVRSREPDY